MNELVRPILVGLETANFSIGLQLGKLPNEDALRQARRHTHELAIEAMKSQQG